MDPRTHVALALQRLHAAPPPLPEVGSLAYRSRLLDETGGDYRPLVVFLLQLAEAGILAQIDAAAASGESWEATHRRLSLSWASEHYTQPDMARWAVAAWGAARGRCPVPEEPRPEPDPRLSPGVPAPPAGQRRTTGVGAAHTAPRAPAPLGYPSPARRAGSTYSAPVGGRRPYFTRAEKQALASIGLTGLVAAGLIAIMSPDGSDVPPPSRPMAAASPSPSADSASPSRRPGAAGTSSARPGGAAGTVAAAAHAPTGANPDSVASLVLTPLDPLQIARLTPTDGAARLRGAYRITTRRQGVYGEDRCNAMAATIAWNQWTLDTIVVDLDAATFRFTSRPTLAGTVLRAGVFASRPIRHERDGTRSTYRLQGQLTPWGFEATSVTRSESMLRWRQTLRCEFVASLSGERLK